MAERLSRQGPLDALGLIARARADDGTGEAGVELAAGEFRGMIILRGDPEQSSFTRASFGALGFALPTEADNTAGHDDLASGPRALWLGPDEWLVVTADDDRVSVLSSLRAALGREHAATVDASDGRTVIRVRGSRSRDVLAKGCPLDLHPRHFPAGRCAHSLIAGIGALIHATATDAKGADAVYEVYVHRSLAAHLWAWLEDAGREYGVRVIADR